MITAEQLVEFAASWLGSQYMYGVNGLVITESLIQAKARKYPHKYTADKIAVLRQNIGRKAVQCNSFTSILLNQERSANGWLSVATESGPISSIPEIPGLTVHFDEHMGIYKGGGKVIEARGTFYGVVETRVIDRPWKTWAKMPGVDYERIESIMLKKGDKGNMVTVWQKALVMSGLKMINDSGVEYPVDGSFGGATENATEQFQTRCGIPATGAVDAVTYSAMTENLLAIAADRLERGELDKVKAIITDAINILNKGVI